MFRLFRRLTKILLGIDWVIYRWGCALESADFRRVRYTNMGRPYIKHIGSTYFLDDDHGQRLFGDTFTYPVGPTAPAPEPR